jgi:hypothetical protein
MTLRPLVVVAIVLALASCARMAPPGDTRSPRDTGVDVVENKYIVIDQEPIIVHGSAVVLKWRLDAGSGWLFPPTNAIVFRDAPAGEFDCRTIADGKQVVCIDRGTRGKYKYDVTVVRGSETLKLDPFVWNL